MRRSVIPTVLFFPPKCSFFHDFFEYFFFLNWHYIEFVWGFIQNSISIFLFVVVVVVVAA